MQVSDDVPIFDVGEVFGPDRRRRRFGSVIVWVFCFAAGSLGKPISDHLPRGWQPVLAHIGVSAIILVVALYAHLLWDIRRLNRELRALERRLTESQ